jgi:hypothetical protein
MFLRYLRETHCWRSNIMPILLWLLGVPLGLVLVLMLFGIA